MESWADAPVTIAASVAKVVENFMVARVLACERGR